MVLCLVMALSLVPVTVFAVPYKAGDISSTTGAGTQSDPVICDNYQELKQALEYDGDLYIRVNNFFNPNSLSYYNLAAGKEYTAGYSAIKVKSDTVKHLEVNANISIKAPSTVDLLYSFINVAGNLTVSGRGTISVAFNATGYPNAVFFITSPGKLKVDGPVTIVGTSIGSGFGRAIENYSGNLDIRGGTFTGASYMQGVGTVDAVLIDSNSFGTTISDGAFSADSHVSGTGYGLIVRGTPTVKLTGGTYYGIDAGTGKYLADMLGEYVKYERADGTSYSPGSVRTTTTTLKVVPDLIDVTSVSVTCPGYKLGGNIADAVPTTTTAGVTISHYEWQDNNGTVLTGGTFAADTQYRVSVYLNPKPGYSITGLTKANVKFNGKETTYFINPTSGDASRFGQAQLYHYPDTLSVPVSSYVTAVDITCPGYKIGGKIADAVPATTTAGVTISGYAWYDNNGNELTGGTFAADTQYRVSVYLNPKPGYSITGLTKANVKFNGKETTYFINPTSGDASRFGQAQLYHYPEMLSVPVSSYITSVDVVCPGYKIGGKIADAVPATTTAGVTISGYEWQDNNGTVLTGGTFAADTQYRVAVYLTAEDGYSLANLTKENVKFNGKTTSYFTNPTSGIDASLGQAELYHYPDRLENTSGVMLGDVDGNGKVNMVDVTKIRQYLTNKTKYPLDVEAAADVDNNGKINMVDVTKIRQYLTNKDKYPLG